MAKIKVTAYLDLDLGELVVELPKMPSPRGRKSNPQAISAARVLADAWATDSWGSSARLKPQRIRNALGIKSALTDDGSLRTAVRQAKGRADSLFPEGHEPGEIYYGRVGAVWFSDRVTFYRHQDAEEILGFAWVWWPGRKAAVWNIVSARLPRG